MLHLSPWYDTWSKHMVKNTRLILLLFFLTLTLRNNMKFWGLRMLITVSAYPKVGDWTESVPVPTHPNHCSMSFISWCCHTHPSTESASSCQPGYLQMAARWVWPCNYLTWFAGYSIGYRFPFHHLLISIYMGWTCCTELMEWIHLENSYIPSWMWHIYLQNYMVWIHYCSYHYRSCITLAFSCSITSMLPSLSITFWLVMVFPLHISFLRFHFHLCFHQHQSQMKIINHPNLPGAAWSSNFNIQFHSTLWEVNHGNLPNQGW